MAQGWQEKGAALEKLQVLGCVWGLTLPLCPQILGVPPQPQLEILSTQTQDSC